MFDGSALDEIRYGAIQDFAVAVDQMPLGVVFHNPPAVNIAYSSIIRTDVEIASFIAGIIGIGDGI